MRGHIVRTFEIVDERGIAIGNESGGEVLEIATDGRIGVLADDERSARVFQEDVAPEYGFSTEQQ